MRRRRCSVWQRPNRLIFRLQNRRKCGHFAPALTFCIIAWRIFWLTMSQREDREASPSQVFSENEQQLLDHFVKDRPSEPRVVTLQHYLRKVGKLGGYLARKHDPPPGNIVIWRGFRKLHDLHAGFLAARQIV